MFSQPLRGWAAPGALAGVLAIAGCGSSGDDPTTTATPAAATATATPASTATPEPATPLPAALRGRWKRTMTTRDWRPAGEGYPLGTWRFVGKPTGDVAVYLPHKAPVDFTTRFVAGTRQLTIESIPVCPDKTGRYGWRASGSKLTMTVVKDPDCPPRAALFGGTWHR